MLFVVAAFVGMLGALVLAAWLLLAQAWASDNHACNTEWTDVAARGEQHDAVMTRLSPQRQREATAMWNATEPVSNDVFAQVYTGETPDGYVRVFFVDAKGCVRGGGHYH